MAAAPPWKVYTSDGLYVGSFRYVEDAAVLADFRGPNSTIRHGHSKKDVVWTEGAEDQPAAESWDHVAEVAHGRVHERIESRRRARA